MKWLLLTMFVLGCGENAIECRHSSDCPNQHVCQKQICHLPEFNQDPLTPAESEPETDSGVHTEDTGQDDLHNTPPDVAVVDAAPPHPCGQARSPVVGDLLINEVYANVASGEAGDANGDGIRDAYSDEFVELVNVGTDTLRLDGVALYVGTTLKFRFDEPYCMQPTRGLVVFSRGTPSLAPDIPVVTADTRLTLTNAGGSVRLKLENTELDRLDWGEGPQASVVRMPELSFSGVPSSHEVCGLLWSPGRCCDGQPLESGCSTD